MKIFFGTFLLIAGTMLIASLTDSRAESDRVTTVVKAVLAQNEETNIPEVHIVDDEGNIMVATIRKAKKACESLL